MKTCLYQPIFINPQAYFVFPSLYNIEKGDSFIEPANITGQLIINTLTDDTTLTPIILNYPNPRLPRPALLRRQDVRSVLRFPDINGLHGDGGQDVVL